LRGKKGKLQREARWRGREGAKQGYRRGEISEGGAPQKAFKKEGSGGLTKQKKNQNRTKTWELNLSRSGCW